LIVAQDAGKARLEDQKARYSDAKK